MTTDIAHTIQSTSWQIQDPVLIFALVMLLILVAPICFARMRIPGIVGLIVVGIVAGPPGFGWFALDNTFELLGKVGLLYLMFLAGFEINLREFTRQRKHSLTFGALTFLIPQVGGALAARWLFDMSWPTAILLASMFASHTLVTYPLLVNLNLTRSRAVTTAIGGTILTDLAALLVLAIIEQTTAESLTWLFWTRQIVLLFLLVWATLWILPQVGYWFFRRAQPDPVSEYLFIVTAAFLSAYAAHLAGVEPIIGAFLAGLALAPLAPEQGVLRNRVQFMGHALFIPFFLLSIGMRVDITILLTDRTAWAIAIFMTVAVHLGKWLAAEGSGRLLGYSRAERSLVFGISVNQAAATLAAVLVGVRIELFDVSILNGTILMILVSCLIGAWATQRFGRAVALEAEPTSPVSTRGDRILVPLSNQLTAPALMELACALRPERSPDRLYPLNVALDGPNLEQRLVEGETVLEAAIVHAVAAGAPVEALARVDINRAGGIIRAAREKRVHTVILGWQRDVSLFFQDLIEQVLDLTRTQLLAARLLLPLNTTSRLLLILPPHIEHQPGFRDTLQHLQRLATNLGADLLLLGDATLRRFLCQIAELAHLVDNCRHYAQWRDWSRWLRDNARESDLLVMMQARRGTAAWHPRLERSLQQLDTTYPQHNIVVAYPALPGHRDSATESADTTATGGLRIEQAVLLPAGKGAADAIGPLVNRMISPPAQKAVAHALSELEPLELQDGVVLLHAHVEQVTGTEIGLAVLASDDGPTPAAPAPLLVFVLLSAKGLAPQAHLQALAAIARLARSPETLDQLRHARAEADCCIPLD